jgi:ferredoxin-fold anticodon binding domain-containing protein
MIFNRRTEIVQFLVSILKEIDGGVSPYDTSYQFNQNVFNNVYRKIKFLDEVNDFPSIYLSAGTEIRNFQSENLTVATLTVTIRAYVYGEDNSQQIADDLVQDIEHVIYNIGSNPEMGILDITIENITQDEGLSFPYGIADVELSVVYRLEY